MTGLRQFRTGSRLVKAQKQARKEGKTSKENIENLILLRQEVQ